MQHYVVDPQPLEFARLSVVGASGPFAGIFGNPYAVMHSMFCPLARILKFLAKAGMK
jgi:hypothetical protein